MPPMRFALAGAGVIGKVHARALASLDEAELVAVADPGPVGTELAGQYGVRAYPDLETLLAAEAVDAVSIATPSGMHAEGAITAMHAGRHVVVEKPADITLPAIDRMLAVQREAGVKLAVISQHRWDPVSQRLYAAVSAGDLGRLVLGNAQVLWWRSQAYYDQGGWRGTWAMDGGGILMNQSIHCIDLLLWFMGPVQSVRAYTGTLAHAIETEDTAVASLRFASGALGSISATTAAYPGYATRIEVFGDRGSAAIENDRLAFLHTSDTTEAGHYGLSPGDVRAQSAAFAVKSENEPAIDTHAAQIADFIQSIHEDGAPLVDGIAGRRAVELILAIYESARTGREVTLPESAP